MHGQGNTKHQVSSRSVNFDLFLLGAQKFETLPIISPYTQYKVFSVLGALSITTLDETLPST